MNIINNNFKKLWTKENFLLWRSMNSTIIFIPSMRLENGNNGNNGNRALFQKIR